MIFQGKKVFFDNENLLENSFPAFGNHCLRQWSRMVRQGKKCLLAFRGFQPHKSSHHLWWWYLTCPGLFLIR